MRGTPLKKKKKRLRNAGSDELVSGSSHYIHSRYILNIHSSSWWLQIFEIFLLKLRELFPVYNFILIFDSFCGLFQ